MPASRSERGANADFFLTRERAREKQIGNVHTRDEKDAAGHGAQHEQSGVRVGHHRLQQRPDFHADVGVRIGILLAQRRADRVHIHLRLCDRNVRLQPRDAFQKIVAALLGHRVRSAVCFAQDRHARPDFRRERTDRENKSCRHDANYLKLFTVQPD